MDLSLWVRHGGQGLIGMAPINITKQDLDGRAALDLC